MCAGVSGGRGYEAGRGRAREPSSVFLTRGTPVPPLALRTLTLRP